MSKKIMMVDDDAELCHELSEILRAEGYLVDELFDSVVAAKAIEESQHDLYLFDYKMPGYSGIDLIKKIKDINASAIIFIISGRPFIKKILQEENVLHLVSAVMIKPFDVEILLQKIKAAI